MRGIRIDSRMPDHQVLEAGYLSRRLQHLDFAIFGLLSCESLRCRQNQFGSRNAPCSRPEIRQRDHGSTAMTVRCETLLRYVLRTFDDVDANVFGREILLQSELTLVRRVRCHNTDKFLLIDHFGQKRRWHMAFIPDQGKIEPTVTQVLEDISSPTCEREANLSRHRENLATENGSDDRGRIVCCRNPEGRMFRHRVEGRTRDEPIQFRQHDLKLLKNTFPLRRWFITLCCAYQQVIVERIPHSLQGTAHRGLAQ